MSGGRAKARVRWPLLVLLWVWALCMFATLDLFLNVEEFDAVRPRARLYRGMRVAAHKLVGEPLPDVDAGSVERPQRVTHRTESGRKDVGKALAAELAAVRDLEELEPLRERAAGAQDPRVRIAALRRLARHFGPAAREALLATAHDEDESLKVRRQAARFLGWTGRSADRDLEEILASELPAPVRAGAVLGLGELGTAFVTERLLAYAASEADSRLREAATEALAAIANPEAGPLLREAVLDGKRRPGTRVAICRSLARSREPASARALSDVLMDRSSPAELRAAAANSLGRLGQREALAVVTVASDDPDPEVARQARIAATRLLHVRVQ